MSKLRLRAVVFMSIAAMLLSACATSSAGGRYGEPLTPEETRLREQRQNFTVTVAQGAVAGAALGALIGGLAGGGRGAAIGAGIGGLTGGVTGAYIASQQRKYANEEARVDAMIADVQNDNDQLRQYVTTAEEVIAADKQKLAVLDAQYANKEISRSEARAKLARIKENRDVIQDALNDLNKKREQYAYAAEQTREDHPTADISDLDFQIAVLESNILVLEEDLTSLNDALAVSPIGTV